MITFFNYLTRHFIKRCGDHNDKKLDKGANFGYANSNEFDILYHTNNTLLEWSLHVLPKNNFRIGDFGGGNGILAKELIDALLLKTITDFTIENIDHDANKFITYTHLINIQHDITDFETEEKYDLSLCKLLLHYFNVAEQEKLLAVIFNNTKARGYLLLENFVVDKKNDYTIKRTVLDYIEKAKGIKKRTIPTTREIEDAIKKAGFVVLREEKINYTVSVSDFYKNRFGLSPEEIEKIEKSVGHKKHGESKLTVLAQKMSGH